MKTPIRPATHSDSRAIAELLAIAAPQHPEIHMPMPSVVFGSGTSDFDGTVLVALENDRIVGVAIAVMGMPLTPGWGLPMVAVSPDRRGQGIAKDLIAQTVDLASVHGVTAIVGQCVPSLTDLYARHGFQILSVDAPLRSVDGGEMTPDAGHHWMFWVPERRARAGVECLALSADNNRYGK